MDLHTGWKRCGSREEQRAYCKFHVLLGKCATEIKSKSRFNFNSDHTGVYQIVLHLGPRWENKTDCEYPRPC